MKTILVLTDLSENAAHAAEVAVTLAGTMNTNLLLYNARIAMPVPTYYADYAGGPWVADDFIQWESESNEKLQWLADDLKPLIANLDPELRKPSVHFECRDGKIAENLAELIAQKNVELIVMGASAEDTLDHILNGSETKAVMNHATCPVLVVPQRADLTKITKVIFATDYAEGDIKGMHYLVMLARLFDFSIEIAHISEYGENPYLTIEDKETFLKQVNKLKYPHISFKIARGKNVIDRLNRLCEEEEANILALVHYQHSFLVHLIRTSTTKRALANQQIPLLIFPSKMEKNYKEFV